jgi:glutathione S-transferase
MGVLHGAIVSPFVRKVRVALAEKGIEYDSDPVMPFGVSDEYKKMSPLGKIPCYTPHDGCHIPDSSVIVAYLERKHSDKPLYPSNPEEFARALFFEEYGDSVLVGALGTVFFNRIVGPMFLDQKPDEAAIKNAMENELPPLLEWLEEQIGDNEFLVGDTFSIADIGVTSPFVNFSHAGESIDASKYPKLAAYLERNLARPSFKACVDEEKALFGG